MKFDLYSWNEVKHASFEAPKGRVQILLSGPGALYAQAQGVEALVGYGAAFDFQTQEDLTLRVEAPKGVRVFRHAPHATAVEASGEVFTNIDRMPDESGSILEVSRATRMFELEKRRMLRELRAEIEEERQSLRRSRLDRQPEGEPEQTNEVATE